jgi:hypothetical protein
MSRLVLVLTLLFVCFVCSACQPEEPRVYGYICKHGSTRSADETAIVPVEGLTIIEKFEFDEENSDIQALKAFRALSMNILSVCSDGKHLYFHGRYNKRKKSFALYDWFIVTPFPERVFMDINGVNQVREKSRNTLKKSDFYGDLNIDVDRYQMRRVEFMTRKWEFKDFKYDGDVKTDAITKEEIMETIK